MKLGLSRIAAMTTAGLIFLFFLVNLLPTTTGTIGGLSVFPQINTGFLSTLDVSDFILIFAMSSFLFDVAIYAREKR